MKMRTRQINSANIKFLCETLLQSLPRQDAAKDAAYLAEQLNKMFLDDEDREIAYDYIESRIEEKINEESNSN